MSGRWRVDAARAAAWAVLLGGWIAIAHAADRLAPGPFVAYALLAAWLLALGGFATLLGRVRLPVGVLRALLLASALIAVRGLWAAVDGQGAIALLPALLAWALLAALASTTVRSLRLAALQRPGPPLAAAACGAAIAWAAAGDPGELRGLAARSAGVLLAAAVVLALLQPGRAAAPARSGCRAGLFDCSLPAWPAGAWRSPARWPLLLASLAMLPMMCGLPQTLALCRGTAIAPQAMLAVHLAAMFVPALCWRAASMRAAALCCGSLLAAGGLAACLDAPGAWWWLALTQGSAWSLAWAAQLANPVLRAGPRSAPLRPALGHAGLALLLGLAVAAAGAQALLALQLALAAGAALALPASASFRQHVAEHLEGLPRRLGR